MTKADAEWIECRVEAWEDRLAVARARVKRTVRKKYGTNAKFVKAFKTATGIPFGYDYIRAISRYYTIVPDLNSEIDEFLNLDSSIWMDFAEKVRNVKEEIEELRWDYQTLSNEIKMLTGRRFPADTLSKTMSMNIVDVEALVYTDFAVTKTLLEISEMIEQAGKEAGE